MCIRDSFSTLHPQTQIAPHSGPCNLRLRCHLPLIVPSTECDVVDSPDQMVAAKDDVFIALEEAKKTMPCGMRVGDQIRCWEEGKAIVFDDTYEHEVWNMTSSPRVLLLLDVWHPELDPDERIAITQMFDYAKSQGWLREKQEQHHQQQQQHEKSPSRSEESSPH